MSDFQNSSSLDSKDAKENSKEESKEDESLWGTVADIGTGDSEHGEESEPESNTSENDKEEARERIEIQRWSNSAFRKVRFLECHAFPFLSENVNLATANGRGHVWPGMMVGYINSFPTSDFW